MKGAWVVWRMLVGILFFLVVGVAVVGYYREWFHVGSISGRDGERTGVEVTVDRDKVKSDIDKAKQRVVPTRADSESD